MDVTTTASSLQAMRNLDAATTMSVEVAAACRDVNEIANATLAFLCRNCLMRSNASSIETLFNAHIDDTRMRPSPLIVWGFGLFFTTLISLCALVGIAIMRVLKKSTFSRFITFFVSLGVGSLSGSAIFHLLPQAFGLVNEFDPNANHDYLYKAFAAIVGIYMFFFLDKAIKIILETRKRRRTEVEMAAITQCENGNATGSNRSSDALLKQKAIKRLPIAHQTSAEADESVHRQAHSLCVHDHDMNYTQGDSVIATVAWMIVFGDGLHNLIDGISIGASFSESVLSGISVSVAVLCEELPHEVGDVAILVSAGMTLRQAMTYNLLSAASCYVGFVIGVLVGNVDESYASYTFGFAGGMFLYISLACMMPDMKAAMEDALNVSLSYSLEVLFLQASGMMCGLTLMACMARFGGEISFG